MAVAPSPECTQSETSKQQARGNIQRPVSKEGSVAACDLNLGGNPRSQTGNTQLISSSFQTQRQDSLNEPGKSLGSSSGDLRGDIGHDHLSSCSLTNLSPGPGTEPLNHGCPLPSRKEHVSSQGFPYVDSEQVHDPPDSTVEDSDVSEFVLNSVCDTVDDGDKVEEANDSLDPDCKASVEVQFNPEEFNFNIGKQTLLSQ